jgi:hypothetical protein
MNRGRKLLKHLSDQSRRLKTREKSDFEALKYNSDIAGAILRIISLSVILGFLLKYTKEQEFVIFRYTFYFLIVFMILIIRNLYSYLQHVSHDYIRNSFFGENLPDGLEVFIYVLSVIFSLSIGISASWISYLIYSGAIKI